MGETCDYGIWCLYEVKRRKNSYNKHINGEVSPDTIQEDILKTESGYAMEEH